MYFTLLFKLQIFLNSMFNTIIINKHIAWNDVGAAWDLKFIRSASLLYYKELLPQTAPVA
jgi:hypothetical protein